MLNVLQMGRGLAIRQRIQRLKLMARSVTNDKLDAIDILQLDHLRAHKMFRSIWWSKDFAEQKKHYELLRSELLMHSDIEEHIFYPVAREREILRDVIDASYEEHALVKRLISEIDSVIENKGEVSQFEAKLDVLFQNVDRHVLQEERTVLPVLRASLSRQELLRLGDRLERERAHRSQHGGRQSSTRHRAA